MKRARRKQAASVGGLVVRSRSGRLLDAGQPPDGAAGGVVELLPDRRDLGQLAVLRKQRSKPLCRITLLLGVSLVFVALASVL